MLGVGWRPRKTTIECFGAAGGSGSSAAAAAAAVRERVILGGSAEDGEVGSDTGVRGKRDVASAFPKARQRVSRSRERILLSQRNVKEYLLEDRKCCFARSRGGLATGSKEKSAAVPRIVDEGRRDRSSPYE